VNNTTVVWVAFCGECDHRLEDQEARNDYCPRCAEQTEDEDYYKAYYKGEIA